MSKVVPFRRRESEDEAYAAAALWTEYDIAQAQTSKHEESDRYVREWEAISRLPKCWKCGRPAGVQRPNTAEVLCGGCAKFYLEGLAIVELERIEAQLES
jgi:hypothetical protein